jgi:hypothetical protein
VKKRWKHYTPEEKVAILRRHLLDKEPSPIQERGQPFRSRQ